MEAPGQPGGGVEEEAEAEIVAERTRDGEPVRGLVRHAGGVPAALNAKVVKPLGSGGDCYRSVGVVKAVRPEASAIRESRPDVESPDAVQPREVGLSCELGDFPDIRIYGARGFVREVEADPGAAAEALGENPVLGPDAPESAAVDVPRAIVHCGGDTVFGDFVEYVLAGVHAVGGKPQGRAVDA